MLQKTDALQENQSVQADGVRTIIPPLLALLQLPREMPNGEFSEIGLGKVAALLCCRKLQERVFASNCAAAYGSIIVTNTISSPHYIIPERFIIFWGFFFLLFFLVDIPEWLSQKTPR